MFILAYVLHFMYSTGLSKLNERKVVETRVSSARVVSRRKAAEKMKTVTDNKSGYSSNC